MRFCFASVAGAPYTPHPPHVAFGYLLPTPRRIDRVMLLLHRATGGVVSVRQGTASLLGMLNVFRKRDSELLHSEFQRRKHVGTKYRRKGLKGCLGQLGQKGGIQRSTNRGSNISSTLKGMKIEGIEKKKEVQKLSSLRLASGQYFNDF